MNIGALQQKSVGTKTNKLDHPGHLHQSPVQLAQELKRICVDWAMRLQRKSAMQTNSPGDKSPAYLATLWDAANSAAVPAWRDEASR